MAHEMTATAMQPTTTVNFMGNNPIIDPKLDGSNNYVSWKFLMQIMLIGMDLWECITGTGTMDTKKDQKALAAICLNVKTHRQYLRLTATAKDAWTILSQVYEDKGLPRVLNLMRVLLKIYYNDFHNMNEYVARAFSL
ncbi:hypothetical protein QLX08_009216 [Tetragonisca angustula]|uniref:DUF4219 domain-containing protein n=1 Tax=Tetragonisca angustula TaxID=166442 RepID=A0AAW0ZJG8_9HYME